jgi:hypothetical protein
VLTNAGAAVVAPLRRIGDARVLLQRSKDAGGTTDALVKRLLIAGPVGTNMHEFPKLNAAAVQDRDTFISRALLT